jgi:tRNA threonylcarbamoyladenosine biosynthesis protein TsaE
VIRTFVTKSEEETVEAGRQLATSLGADSVVLLLGDLGAGKTAFVRGLAEGLGASPADVSSPTFTLIQEYRRGRIPLLHADLYRLNNPQEVEELGLEELGSGAVVAVEWAEKLPHVPADAIRVSIEHLGEDERRVTIETEKARSKKVRSENS